MCDCRWLHFFRYASSRNHLFNEQCFTSSQVIIDGYVNNFNIKAWRLTAILTQCQFGSRRSESTALAPPKTTAWNFYQNLTFYLKATCGSWDASSTVKGCMASNVGAVGGQIDAARYHKTLTELPQLASRRRSASQPYCDVLWSYLPYFMSIGWRLGETRQSNITAAHNF